MSTLHEDRIQSALNKACNVGLVEERFVVTGCNVAMRNLRPEEYQAIMDEIQGLQDVAFANAYQMGHICRSVIEVGDIDLRDVEFIESEIPDPKNPGKMKKVTLEKHDWLLKKVFATWGKESLTIIFRKFTDVLELADRQASEGVTFVVPDETPEDKFRRLLGELKELENALPEELVGRLLDDNGYGLHITKDEMALAQDHLSDLKMEPKEEEPEVVVPQPIPQPRAEEEAPRPDPRELMLRRKPMNQEPNAPVPQIPPQPAAPPVVTAKAKAYADLEAEAIALNGGLDVLPPRPREIAELSRPIDRTPTQVVLDAPPTSGINPRFRPPSKS